MADHRRHQISTYFATKRSGGGGGGGRQPKRTAEQLHRGGITFDSSEEEDAPANAAANPTQGMENNDAETQEIPQDGGTRRMGGQTIGAGNMAQTSNVYAPLSTHWGPMRFKFSEIWNLRNKLPSAWTNVGAGPTFTQSTIDSDLIWIPNRGCWNYLDRAAIQALRGINLPFKLSKAKKCVKTVQVFPQNTVGTALPSNTVIGAINPQIYVVTRPQAVFPCWSTKTYDGTAHTLASLKTLQENARYEAQEAPFVTFTALKRDTAADTGVNKKLYQVKDLTTFDKDSFCGFEMGHNVWNKMIATTGEHTLETFNTNNDNAINNVGNVTSAIGVTPTFTNFISGATVGPVPEWSAFQLDNVGLRDISSLESSTHPIFLKIQIMITL